MTAATLSSLPLSAGGAAAASLARGVYWVLNRLIDFGYFAVAQFMRAPVAISTVAAIIGFSLLAGGNALYFQASRHPAPLFFAPSHHVTPAPAVRPVIPATRHPQAAIDEETTGSLGPSASVETIDNADVMTLQRKLASLKLFEGTADGIFGRRTATAIKMFEIKAGMKPRGKLTRELLASVLAAPVPAASEPVPATTVADITPTATARPAAARPAPTPMMGAAPVPLAPLPRTVSTVRVADVAPVAPADTFAANSLPADDSAPVAPAAVAPSAPASQALASAAPAPSASKPAPANAADDGSVVAMSTLPQNKPTPAVAAPAAAPTAPTVTQQVASVEPSPAIAPQDSATPAAAALDNAAPLTPAQKLAAQMGTLPPGATPAGSTPTVVASTDASSDPGDDAGSTDPALITKIQRGLASLGFLAQKIDGVPGEGTAKAIRNFEVFYDYKVTGLATPQLVNLLVQHGAQI